MIVTYLCVLLAGLLIWRRADNTLRTQHHCPMCGSNGTHADCPACHGLERRLKINKNKMRTPQPFNPYLTQSLAERRRQTRRKEDREV